MSGKNVGCHLGFTDIAIFNRFIPYVPLTTAGIYLCGTGNICSAFLRYNWALIE